MSCQVPRPDAGLLGRLPLRHDQLTQVHGPHSYTRDPLLQRALIPRLRWLNDNVNQWDSSCRSNKNLTIGSICAASRNVGAWPVFGMVSSWLFVLRASISAAVSCVSRSECSPRMINTGSCND